MEGSERAPDDSLAPEAVESLLRGGWGRPYLYRESCESSQKLLELTLDEGTVAVCDEQTAGRGRLGRSWVTPPGTAVLCSILLRPPAERRAPELSLVGGVATALVVERALGLASQIKWPNDVMVNRRKVAGVLAEQVDEVVLLGVGLNVNQTREELPGDATVPPASLYTVDAVRRARAPLLAELVLETERAYKLWAAGGIDALYEELGPRDFLRNRRVYVNGDAGLAVAIDRSGRLQVDVQGERRVVESGEVRYER
jgi:BirA family transcriptional regulator, biotin operon repressor / biotin---[acetyl-CoA-carboxylase] ligase